MRPEIQKYATRQKWIYRAAQILAAPLQPYFMAKRGVEWATNEISKLHRQIKEKLGWHTEPEEAVPDTDRILLPQEHPITQAVTKVASLAGVKNYGTYIEFPQDDLINGRMRDIPKSREQEAGLQILFTGHPLSNEGAPEIMMGVIGHEVAHTLTPDPIKIRILSEQSKNVYSHLALSGLAVAATTKYLKTTDSESFLQVTSALQIEPLQLAHILQATPSYDLLAGASVIALAVGYSMQHLSRWHSHSIEYLCDLRGAELTSPKETLASLEHIQGSQEASNKNILRSIWDKIASPLEDTHPNIKNRIALIRKAFNVQGDVSATTKERKTPPAPPPSQQP